MIKGERQELVGYKKLIVYQKAKKLTLMTYKLTTSFPKTETYTLVPQMRRSAVSVVANLVEGYSIGSLTELEVFLELSLDLQFIKLFEHTKTVNLLNEVKRLLYGTRKKVLER